MSWMNGGRDSGIALGLLSFAAGSMDAIAFLALREVFTSAMSGNTILLGLALGQGRIFAALHSLAAFLGYACGVALAALTLLKLPQGIGRTLFVETAFLAAFAGLWTVYGGPMDSPTLYALIALSAIAMGLQGAIGRAIRIPGISTIVITSTVTAIIGAFAERTLKGERPLLTGPMRRQIASFLAYLVSAVICGLAMQRWLGVLPFLPLAAVLALAIGLRFRWLEL